MFLDRQDPFPLGYPVVPQICLDLDGSSPLGGEES